MKIAFVVINANRHEGTSRAVLEVAERLCLNHTVDLWSRTADAHAQNKLHWIRVAGPGRPEIVDFATFRWSVDRQLKRSNYDIIHSAGPNTSLADIYTIQTVHPVKMSLVKESRSVQSVSWARRLSWALYDRFVVNCESKSYTATGPRGPRAFLPVSLGTQTELLSNYHGLTNKVEPTNIAVVPNGADLELFHPRNRAAHRDPIRRRHKLDSKDFVLLFSGGDWRRKGLDLAIRTLPLLNERRIKLLVVGDDRNGAEVRQLVESSKLTDRVCFAGFQKNVHEYYAAADLFLFPTMYEAFSLATIEAAASGLPVLMPDVSGAQELIGAGNTGTMIRRDPNHIAETVMAYFHSPALVESSGNAARRLVECEFSWDSITAKTLAVYEKVVALRAANKP